MTVYANKGNRVEVQGELIVRASNGTVIDRYPIEQIQRAVDQVDQLVDSEADNLILPNSQKRKG
jgi:hypothetical protein